MGPWTPVTWLQGVGLDSLKSIHRSGILIIGEIKGIKRKSKVTNFRDGGLILNRHSEIRLS